jgi:hypothetical protein
MPDREEAQGRADEGVRLDVVKWSVDIAPQDIAKLRDLGFVLRTAKLVPDRIGPKADIVCVSGC